MKDLKKALQREINNPTNFLQADKPFPVSATPFILNERDYNNLTYHARNVYTAIEKVTEAYILESSVQDLFPEYASVRSLSRLVPRKSGILNLARFDFAVLKNGQFKMMETNSGCPGALTTVGLINNAFLKNDKTYRRILEDRIPLQIDLENYFVNYLADLTRESQPNSNSITMAFVSSSHRRIVTDLNKLTELASAAGFQPIRCDVQDLSYDGTKLRYNGAKIDCAFLKFDSVIDNDGDCDLGIYGKNIDSDDMPLMRAMRDEAFVYVNTFPSMLVAESKRILALLFDPLIRNHLSPDECSSIDAVVAKTSYLGQNRPCIWGVEELSQNKDNFVIKSVIDTRGRGVYLGKYTSQEEWDLLLKKCRDSKHVVQEFLSLDRQTVERPIGEAGNFEAFTDIGLYQLGGRSVGFLCRASEKPVVNVGNGGALRPTFVVKK